MSVDPNNSRKDKDRIADRKAIIPSPPVPIYLQLVVALSCVVFASTYLLAGLWVKPSLNQTVGRVQFGFVAISVCVLVFEFDIYPLLFTKPDILGDYLIPVAALSFLIACALFVANETWTVIRAVRGSQRRTS